MSKRLILQIGNHLLDNGVVAMLSLDDRDLLAAVGEKREVSPVGPQLRLGAEKPGSYSDFGPATTGTTFGFTSEKAVPGELAVSYYTEAKPSERAFEGPDDGSTSGVSANGQVWFNAFITTGVNVGQANATHPCLFVGHIYSPSIK